MAVVGNGGGHGTGFQTVALQVADADVAGVLMTLYHSHFQNVVFQIHLFGIPLILGDDLSVDHADDSLAAAFGEIRGGKDGQMEGVVGLCIEMGGDEGSCEVVHLTIVIDQMAFFVDADHMEVLQVFDDGEVCQVSGSDGTTIVQQEITGGMETGNLDHLNGIGAHADSLTADIVHVALFQEVAGMLVIGAEHTAVEIFR